MTIGSVTIERRSRRRIDIDYHGIHMTKSFWPLLILAVVLGSPALMKSPAGSWQDGAFPTLRFTH